MSEMKDAELTAPVERISEELTLVEVEPDFPATPTESASHAQKSLGTEASRDEASPLAIGGQEPGRILSFEEALEYSRKRYAGALRLLAQ